MARSFSQLDKRQQVIICVVVPLCAAAGLLYFSHKILKDLGPDPALPTFLQKPGGTWTEINDTQVKVEAQIAIINRKPKVELQLKALQGEIKIAEERLPLEAEKTVVRSLIEEMARNVPTNIGTVQFKGLSIQAGGVVKGEDYQPITYRTEIMADLNGLIKYIDQIEKNTRFMMVRNISIRPGALSINSEKQQIVSALHSVNMDIVTYVYNPGASDDRRRR